LLRYIGYILLEIMPCVVWGEGGGGRREGEGGGGRGEKGGGRKGKKGGGGREGGREGGGGEGGTSCIAVSTSAGYVLGNIRQRVWYPVISN
jgi:hypothetical protein